MLENVDLQDKLDEATYQSRMLYLEPRIGELQRKIQELGIPLLIVFEGWKAAGKGSVINKLMLNLDPRGFTVHSIQPPTEEERLRPYMWRFWQKTPARGRIALFDHSWYQQIVAERTAKNVKKKRVRCCSAVISFESQLFADGAVILKFFLHITKKEQHKRFRKLAGDTATAWKVTKEDLKNHDDYQRFYDAYEEVMAETNSPEAPWTIVAAHDLKTATVKVFETIVTTLEARVEHGKERVSLPRLNKMPQLPLAEIDLSQELSQSEYESQVKKKEKHLRELEFEIYQRRIPVVVLFEGWDAAGKGGNIKRLAARLDPRGYEVIPIMAPNDVEKAHHYLWRFWNHFPKAGHIGIFDRSWYGRVLVERVEAFCSVPEWKRAYQEINEMEAQWADFGAVLIKFWLQISAGEQLRRFEERQNTPGKRWKITEEDWRNRAKWDQYQVAVNEMLSRTDTPHAPWTIVEAESKWFGRIKTLNTVIAAIEKRL